MRGFDAVRQPGRALSASARGLGLAVTAVAVLVAGAARPSGRPAETSLCEEPGHMSSADTGQARLVVSRWFPVRALRTRTRLAARGP